MPNPCVCDNCWAEYFIEKGSPVKAAISKKERSCKGMEQWACPPNIKRHGKNMYAGDPFPKWCCKKFEQSVAAGMEKSNA